MEKAAEYFKNQIGKDARHSPSPLMRWLNPVLVSAEPGALVFQYEVKHDWLNPMGNLHGGTAAAIIDDAIGATAFSFGEAFFYATINNSIDYFGTAREGDKIFAKTSTIKKGKQIINAQCELWNGNYTRMLAKGYSNMLKTNIEK